MSARTVVCTVVARNYVAYARVLARSLREHAPGLPYIVLLIDEPGAPLDPAAESFPILALADLGIPDIRPTCFRLDRRELASFVKPFLLQHLLDEGADAAIFLDPDVLVVGDLTPLVRRVLQHPLTVTPHLITPPEGDRAPEHELNIVLSGTFNAGFAGVARSRTAQRFLQWWQDRVRGACSHAVADGVFYDQRWLDLAPGLFDGVQVVRDPGWNIAYWNLPERAVRTVDGSWFAGDCPARFFHFSGFVPGEWERLSRYSTRATAADIGEAAAVFQQFDRLLADAGHAETWTWPYGFGFFDNGAPVPAIVRRLHAELGDTAAAHGDPFVTSPPASFFRWLVSPVSPARQAPFAVSHLWQAIYDRRGDLQRALPAIHDADAAAFQRWVRTFGRAEYDMPRELIP
jgi:hypothetical protein